MKKSPILVTAVLAVGANIAQAAFLAPGATGRIEFTSGCFRFGECLPGDVNITDNGVTSGGIGSGIAGDGLVGLIEFAMSDGNSFSVTSFSQDTYLTTPVGNKSIDAASTASMSGFISDSGDITLDVSGRISYWQYFPHLGIQPWNIDDSVTIAGQGDPQTGSYDIFTSGTTSAWEPGSPGTPFNVQTGEALTPIAPGIWSGVIVMSGNTGKDWEVFDGSPYTERFEIRLVEEVIDPFPVPVPAAGWLFGFGLLGLGGIVKRRHTRGDPAR